MYDSGNTTHVLFCPDRTQDYAWEELYILPLTIGVNAIGAHVLSGLVIEQVPSGSYRRTGYFQSRENEVEAFLEAQKRATYEDKFFAGEAHGPDENGQKMCIIDLI